MFASHQHPWYWIIEQFICHVYNATNDATRGGLGLGKELMDGVWQVFSRYGILYSYCRYGSRCYVVGGRYLLVQFSAVFTMLTAECIVLPSSPSPHTTEPPLGTYHQNTFVTPSSPVKSDAAATAGLRGSLGMMKCSYIFVSNKCVWSYLWSKTKVLSR